MVVGVVIIAIVLIFFICRCHCTFNCGDFIIDTSYFNIISIFVIGWVVIIVAVVGNLWGVGGGNYFTWE